MADSNRRMYELALLATVVAILAAFLLPALERTRRDFEEAAVQSEVAALRVELLDRLAHREAVGGALPGGANPAEWTAYRPQGYVGELDSAPAESGVWYFDRRAGELVYRYRAGGEARFRLTRGVAGVDVGVAAPGRLAGVGLVRVSGASAH